MTRRFPVNRYGYVGTRCRRLRRKPGSGCLFSALVPYSAWIRLVAAATGDGQLLLSTVVIAATPPARNPDVSPRQSRYRDLSCRGNNLLKLSTDSSKSTQSTAAVGIAPSHTGASQFREIDGASLAPTPVSQSEIPRCALLSLSARPAHSFSAARPAMVAACNHCVADFVARRIEPRGSGLPFQPGVGCFRFRGRFRIISGRNPHALVDRLEAFFRPAHCTIV